MPNSNETPPLTRAQMVELLFSRQRELNAEAGQARPRGQSWTAREWQCIQADLVLYGNWMYQIGDHLRHDQDSHAINAARKTPEVPEEFWVFTGADKNGDG